MQHSKEILIFLLFVGLSTLLWWVNAANKKWQHSAVESTSVQEEETIRPEEQLTDKKMEVPIEVLEVPEGKNIRVFPVRAVVFLRVRVMDYKEINASDVRVWCTYPTTHMDYLTLHVDVQDERIYSVRLDPDKVEYIIEN